MEENELRKQLCTVDESLLFLGLLLLSVGLSYWGVSIQREGLCRTIRGDGAGAAALPEVFPIRLWASVLVFLAALLRLDDLLKHAPRPGDCCS